MVQGQTSTTKPDPSRWAASSSTALVGRVLLAEDDPTVGEILETLLTEDGMEVTLAADGREALQLAEHGTFDLVLLDVMMPEVDGMTVCRTLRADARYANVPIVMLTAVDNLENAREAFQSGANDYMTKPFAPALFRARVRSWIARGNAR
jgi:two-component system response regulator RpaA